MLNSAVVYIHSVHAGFKKETGECCGCGDAADMAADLNLEDSPPPPTPPQSIQDI